MTFCFENNYVWLSFSLLILMGIWPFETHNLEIQEINHFGWDSPFALTIDSLPTIPGRTNEFQDSLLVNSDELIIRVWDSGVVDKDKIDIVHLYETEDGIKEIQITKNLELKRKKEKIYISLKPNTVNYLRMDVRDMGLQPSFNTARFDFSAGGYRSEKKYILNADEEKSAVFKLIMDPDLDTPFREFLQVNNSIGERILDTLFLKGTEDNIFVSSNCMGQGIESILTLGSQTKYLSKMENGESILFINEDLVEQPAVFLKVYLGRRYEDEKCRVDITSTLKGNKKVYQDLEITEQRSYVIPVKVVEKIVETPPIEIVVNTDHLLISLHDPSKEDGEIITVMQNDSVIISEYELVKTPKKWDIYIDSNTVTEFKFIPIDEGTIPYNTTMVNVYAGEERIADYKLTSSKIGHPIKLIVTHKPK